MRGTGGAVQQGADRGKRVEADNDKYSLITSHTVGQIGSFQQSFGHKEQK